MSLSDRLQKVMVELDKLRNSNPLIRKNIAIIYEPLREMKSLLKRVTGKEEDIAYLELADSVMAAAIKEWEKSGLSTKGGPALLDEMKAISKENSTQLKGLRDKWEGKAYPT